MTDPAVRVIADALPSLMHPGDDKRKPAPIVLPMFRAYASMPADMRRDYAEEAGLDGESDLLVDIATAVVHALKAAGLPPTSETALAELNAAAAANEDQRHRKVDIHCMCGAKLFGAQVTDFATDRATINGPNVIKALRHVSHECSMKHRVEGYR